MFTLYLKPQNYPSTLLLTKSLIKVPTPHRVTPTSLTSADQRIEGDQAWAQLASTAPADRRNKDGSLTKHQKQRLLEKNTSGDYR